MSDTLRTRKSPPISDRSNVSSSPSLSSKEGASSPMITTTKKQEEEEEKENHPRISISTLDILRILAGLCLLSITLSYFLTGTSILWGYRPAYTRPARIKAWLRGPISLTDTDLRAYDGTNPSLPIYLALNGSIYDVSASPQFYGPGGSYHFFAGRDATRAYITGCFDSDLTPDLRGVEMMFVPFPDDEIDGAGEDGGKKERKLRTEREKRLARRKVRDVVRGWERMFDGGKEGRYFKVGTVKRDEGWDGEERLGPPRELCQKAREARPKREKGKG